MSDFIKTHEHVRKRYITIIITFSRHDVLIQAKLFKFMKDMIVKSNALILRNAFQKERLIC